MAKMEAHLKNLSRKSSFMGPLIVAKVSTDLWDKALEALCFKGPTTQIVIRVSVSGYLLHDRLYK